MGFSLLVYIRQTLHCTALFKITPWTAPSTSRMVTANHRRRQLKQVEAQRTRSTASSHSASTYVNPRTTYAYIKTRKSFCVPIHWYWRLLNSWLLIDFYLFYFHQILGMGINTSTSTVHYSTNAANECANTRCGTEITNHASLQSLAPTLGVSLQTVAACCSS